MADDLLAPVVLAPGITLRNRVAMAPMTTWASNDDATVSDDEEAYYRRRAHDAGLIVTGCTHVQASGMGFTGEFAAYDDRFLPSLRRLATAAKSGGAVAVLQIFHAGNKAVPELVPGGDVVSASAVTSDPGPFNRALAPRAMTQDEIPTVIAEFGAATRRAIEAGFDGIELHGAHGFLLQNFFSPRFNQRDDHWGGSLEHRMRFPLAVVAEVRRVIAEHAKGPFLLGYRISPEEGGAGGLRFCNSAVLISRLIEGGIDYLHASLSDVLASKPIDQEGDETVAARLVAEVGGRVPVIAAGHIRTPAQARQALALGISVVAIGQALVINPDWVQLARSGQDAAIETALDRASISAIELPAKLWTVIEETPGWFQVQGDPSSADAR